MAVSDWFNSWQDWLNSLMSSPGQPTQLPNALTPSPAGTSQGNGGTWNWPQPGLAPGAPTPWGPAGRVTRADLPYMQGGPLAANLANIGGTGPIPAPAGPVGAPPAPGQPDTLPAWPPSAPGLTGGSGGMGYPAAGVMPNGPLAGGMGYPAAGMPANPTPAWPSARTPVESGFPASAPAAAAPVAAPAAAPAAAAPSGGNLFDWIHNAGVDLGRSLDRTFGVQHPESYYVYQPARPPAGALARQPSAQPAQPAAPTARFPSVRVVQPAGAPLGQGGIGSDAKYPTTWAGPARAPLPPGTVSLPSLFVRPEGYSGGAAAYPTWIGR